MFPLSGIYSFGWVGRGVETRKPRRSAKDAKGGLWMDLMDWNGRNGRSGRRGYEPRMDANQVTSEQRTVREAPEGHRWVGLVGSRKRRRRLNGGWVMGPARMWSAVTCYRFGCVRLAGTADRRQFIAKLRAWWP
jgi:hypothetical protein